MLMQMCDMRFGVLLRREHRALSLEDNQTLDITQMSIYDMI